MTTLNQTFADSDTRSPHLEPRNHHSTVIILSAAKDLLFAPTKPGSTLIVLVATKGGQHKRIEMKNSSSTKFPDENFSRPVPRKIFTTGSNAGKNPCGWLRLAPSATLRYPAGSSLFPETPGASPQRSPRQSASRSHPAGRRKEVC
jgi:hypothetical protein